MATTEDEASSQRQHTPGEETKEDAARWGGGVTNHYHDIAFRNIVGSSIVAFCKDGATGGNPHIYRPRPCDY